METREKGGGRCRLLRQRRSPFAYCASSGSKVLVALVVGFGRRVAEVCCRRTRERLRHALEAVVLLALVGDAQKRADDGFVAELLGALIAEMSGNHLAADLPSVFLASVH